MYRISLILLVTLLLSPACRNEETPEDNPWPVWILRVTVHDGDNNNEPPMNCAHAIWSYQGSEETHDWGCRETNDYVRVWDSIDGDTRIFFHIECDGYVPSAEFTVDYDYARVDTTNPQAEVVENRTVTIYRN